MTGVQTCALPISPPLNGVTKSELVQKTALAFQTDSSKAVAIAKALTKRHSKEFSKFNQMKEADALEYLLQKATGEEGSSQFCRTLWVALLDQREFLVTRALDIANQFQGVHKPCDSEASQGQLSQEDSPEEEEEGDFIPFSDFPQPENSSLMESLRAHPDELLLAYEKLYEAASQRERYLIRWRRKEKKSEHRHENVQKTLRDLQDSNTQLKTCKGELKTQLHDVQQQYNDLGQQMLQLTTLREYRDTLQAKLESLEMENVTLREQVKERETFKKDKEELQIELANKAEEYFTLHATYMNTLENFIDERERFIAKLNWTREEAETTLVSIENERILHLSRAKGSHSVDVPAVGVFVDVQNMFYAARKRYNGKLNYQALLTHTVKKRQLAKAVCYIIQTPDVDQSSFIALLERCGFQVKSKELKTRLDGSAKGDWDMEIAMDIISSVHKLDVVVLVSGDGDFAPLVRMIKKHGITVEVASFEYNTAMELREVADEFLPIGHSLILGL